MLFVLIENSKVKIARHIYGCYLNILYRLNCHINYFLFEDICYNFVFRSSKILFNKAIIQKGGGTEPYDTLATLEKEGANS
jgi:hypothetical protein